MDAAERLVADVYGTADLSLDAAFAISEADIKHVNTIAGSQKAVNYGEVPNRTWSEVLNRLQLTTDDVFYDLGSGRGALAMFTHVACKLRKSVGIELSRERHTMRVERAGRRRRRQRARRPRDCVGRGTGQVVHGRRPEIWAMGVQLAWPELGSHSEARTSRKVRRSRDSPIAVRGLRARMSVRSGKHDAAVGEAQVYRAPSVISSGKPLTSAVSPRGTVEVTVAGIQPSVTPRLEARCFTHSVCENSTADGPNPIHPWRR